MVNAMEAALRRIANRENWQWETIEGHSHGILCWNADSTPIEIAERALASAGEPAASAASNQYWPLGGPL